MSIEHLRKNLNKEFGDSLKRADEIQEIPIIAGFGSLALDIASGLGGIPRSRIIEMLGPEQGGKTALSLLSIAEVQKIGGVAAFLDLENSFDPRWAKNLGCNLDENKFLFFKPKSGAEAFEIIEDLVESMDVDLIVADSVHAFITDSEAEGNYGDSMMAQLSRLMSNSLKKINSKQINYSRASIIFINQMRQGIGQFSKDESTGGNALRHYASVRLYIRRVGGKDGIIGDPTNPEGFKTSIQLKKNKIGVPLKVVETKLYIGPKKFGIDKNEEVIDVAKSLGLIKRLAKNKDTNELVINPDGSYYQIDGYEPIYGQSKFELFIAEKPEIKDQLLKQINIFTKKNNEPESDSFAAEVKEEEKKQRKSRKNKDEEIKSNS